MNDLMDRIEGDLKGEPLPFIKQGAESILKLTHSSLMLMDYIETGVAGHKNWDQKRRDNCAKAALLGYEMSMKKLIHQLKEMRKETKRFVWSKMGKW